MMMVTGCVAADQANETSESTEQSVVLGSGRSRDVLPFARNAGKDTRGSGTGVDRRSSGQEDRSTDHMA